MASKKFAQANHYQQIATVFTAVRGLANTVAKTPSNGPADKSVKSKIRDLLQTAYQLYYTAKNDGMTAATSASYRNNLEAKLDDALNEVRHQEYNPYGQNVYVAVENAAPGIYNALQRYVPESIAAQQPKQAPTSPTAPIGPQAIPQYQSALPPEKKPWESYEPETIPAPPGSGWARIPAVDTLDTGMGKAKPAPEPGFTFPPAGIQKEPRLAPPVVLPSGKTYPGPGEVLRRSNARRIALRKLAGF